MSRQPVITIKMHYYSPFDEDAFFDWIKKIPSIVEYKGVYNELDLYIKNKRISDKDLKEIISFFYRYKADMKQLQVFLNSKNKEWFYDNKKAYWHKRVFGKAIKK